MVSIVCILGSPRAGGNSSVLADAFCQSAEGNGALVRKFQLNAMNFNGCQNLFKCKTGSESCGQSDDLTEVLDAIPDADIVVLASPIYFTDVTSQMKMCIDRWFSFFVPGYANADEKSRLKSGKVMVFIQTQGEGEAQYKELLPKYNHSFQLLGFTESHLIRAANVREIGDIYRVPEVIEQARQLGEKLSRFS